MGASVYELPPGQALCPYHYESDEELGDGARGRGQRPPSRGHRRARSRRHRGLPGRPRRAHKVFNASAETVRFIMLSTKGDPGYAIYPDSNKIQFFTGRPEERALVRLGENLDYYDGELP